MVSLLLNLRFHYYGFCGPESVWIHFFSGDGKPSLLEWVYSNVVKIQYHDFTKQFLLTTR